MSGKTEIIDTKDIEELVERLIKSATSQSSENKFSWEEFQTKIDTFINGFTLLRNELQSNNSQNEKILSLGTRLLFSLRQFLTGETLYFVVGGTAKIDKEETLVEKRYSQNEIFSFNEERRKFGFKVNLTAYQIQLENELERLNNLKGTKEQRNISNLNDYWKILLKAGFVTSKGEGKPQNDDDDVYKKDDRDSFVYFYFRNIAHKEKDREIADSVNEKTKNAIFYRYENEPAKAYNKGWLYQWLKMMNEKELKDLVTAEHPLGIVISGNRRRERIEGITGGDFKNEQYKYYNNPTIITFDNILKITNKILIELEEIRDKGILDSAVMEKLISLFLNEENKEKLGTQLKSLTKFLYLGSEEIINKQFDI